MHNYNAKHHAYGIVMLIIALVISVLLSSCATEKTVIKFHDKCVRKHQDSVFYKLFIKWCPITENTTVKTIYRPGKPIIKKGKDSVVFVDCDSAYRVALALAKKTGKNISQIKVSSVAIKISTGDTIMSKDTIDNYTKVVKESTAKESLLRDQKNTVEVNLQKQIDKTDKVSIAYHKWKKRALYEGGFIGILAALVGFSIYRKISKSYSV